jgi:hypothetical protein
MKMLHAYMTFSESIRIGLAEEVLIPCLGTEGLLANVLHVLEVIHRVRPDARVHIDWVLTGAEEGFRYGDVGTDVWAHLFRALGSCLQGSSVRAASALDFAFWGTGKEYLTGQELNQHRNDYNRTLEARMEIINQRVRNEVTDIDLRTLSGRFSVGVHRRVGNPKVANCQSDGTVPSVERFIECIREKIGTSLTADWKIFLASDDVQAVPPFRQAFGDRLVVRDHVQRTVADEPEVHYRNWGQLSLVDAEDVLIDTLLLARCKVLIHASSSISTFASLVNPALDLVSVT